MQRRCFNQTTTLDERLEEQAERLRKEAEGKPPFIERDILIRKARHAETGARIQDWLKSTGLCPPE
jgi:hypothetical protein